VAICDILCEFDPRLKKLSIPITEITSSVSQNIKDLLETFASAPGVGIAMPQIGILERVVIVDASRQTKIKEKFNGQIILVNPVITKSEGTQIFREGCLSVPEYTGYVQRFEKVWVKAFDQEMNQKEYEFNGFESVIVQHEMDHLDGILFIDRVISPGQLFRRKGIRA
jgi:peptide deformylase